MSVPADLREVRVLVLRLASELCVPPHYLPTFGKSDDGGRRHIETDARGYHYVVVERGVELSRETTREIQELLYWAARDLTFNMAVDFELADRESGWDSRRLLKPAWAKRCEAEIADILVEHPYSDERSAPG